MAGLIPIVGGILLLVSFFLQEEKLWGAYDFGQVLASLGLIALGVWRLTRKPPKQ